MKLTREMLALLMTLAFVAGMAVFAGLVRLLADPPTPEVVSYQAAKRQPDGSVIAERAPVATPADAGKPPHTIPKGHTEVRRVSATVQPKPTTEGVDCPTVRIDASLVRDGAGGQRVIVSSPDGEVVRAIDVPIAAQLIPPPPRRWAAGLSYDPFNRGGGTWIERDVGRLRLGAEVQTDRGGEFRALVRAGWTF